MPNWKKVITSGSNAVLNEITASGAISASTYYGDGSNLTGINTGSWDGIFTGSAEITGSLEVIGSTTINGNTIITSSNSLSGNYALKVVNSSGTDILAVENDGNTTSYKNLIQQNLLNNDDQGIRFKSENGTYTGYLQLGHTTTPYDGRLYFPHSATIQVNGAARILNLSNGTQRFLVRPDSGLYSNYNSAFISAGHQGSFGFYTYGSTHNMPVMRLHNRSNNSNYGVKLVYESGSVEYDGITLDRDGDVEISNGSLNVFSSVSAPTYYGDGSNLTGINTGSWDGIFTGSAVITGSLEISNTLFTTISSSVSTGTTTLYTFTNYEATHAEYKVKNGSNLRTGTVIGCWDGSSVDYTETSVKGLGNTSDVSFAFTTTGQLQITTSDTYEVKITARAL
jgi:hypothetical protein